MLEKESVGCVGSETVSTWRGAAGSVMYVDVGGYSYGCAGRVLDGVARR